MPLTVLPPAAPHTALAECGHLRQCLRAQVAENDYWRMRCATWEEIGRSLLAATALSAGGYVLIRAGRRSQADESPQWRVNVRDARGDRTASGRTLLRALTHAVECLPGGRA
jgi:hypothetical protein